jgi:hypothetical protein
VSVRGQPCVLVEGTVVSVRGQPCVLVEGTVVSVRGQPCVLVEGTLPEQATRACRLDVSASLCSAAALALRVSRERTGVSVCSS